MLRESINFSAGLSVAKNAPQTGFFLGCNNNITPNDLFKKHEPIPASFGLFSFFTAIIFADKLYTSAGYELRSLEASTLTTWPPPPWLCIIDLKEHFWKAQFIPVTVIL